MQLHPWAGKRAGSIPNLYGRQWSCFSRTPRCHDCLHSFFLRFHCAVRLPSSIWVRPLKFQICLAKDVILRRMQLNSGWPSKFFEASLSVFLVIALCLCISCSAYILVVTPRTSQPHYLRIWAMASSRRLLLLVDAVLSLLVAVRGDHNVSYPNSACQQLGIRYQNQTSSLGSNEYVVGIASMWFRCPRERGHAKAASENWSESCVLQAYCLFEPTCASDVAGALAILTATDTKFAIRGGGHMPVPGATGIADGVLISMEKLNLMQLTNNQTIAQLEPGLRWGAVYDWIAQYKRGIVGGR